MKNKKRGEISYLKMKRKDGDPLLKIVSSLVDGDLT
jgi:hypothetical protein